MEPLDRFDCLQNNSLWQGTTLGIESKVYIQCSLFPFLSSLLLFIDYLVIIVSYQYSIKLHLSKFSMYAL